MIGRPGNRDGIQAALHAAGLPGLSRTAWLAVDLDRLRDNLVAGQRLSPLPAQLNQLFETLLADAEPVAHEILVTERETLETLALTSGGDPELFDRSVQLFLDVMKGTTA